MNANAIRANSGVSIPELIARFEVAQTRLEAQAIQATDCPLAISVKVGSKYRTFEQLMMEVEAHIRNHHEECFKAS